MSNDQTLDYRTRVRYGDRVLGGLADGLEVTWAKQFATVHVPCEGSQMLIPLVRRQFIRDPKIDNLPHRQVAFFWCCPSATDSVLEALAAKRWP